MNGIKDITKLDKKKLAIICSSAFSLINFRYELIFKLKKKFHIETFSEDYEKNVTKKLKKIDVKNTSYGSKFEFSYLIYQILSLVKFLIIFKRRKKYYYYFIYTIKSILFSAFLNLKGSKVIFLITGLVLFKDNNYIY